MTVLFTDDRPSTVQCMIRRAADTTTTMTTTMTTTYKTRPSTRTERPTAAAPPSPLLLLLLLLLYAVASVPAAAASPAIGDMSLLTMQRIKSYVDDTCTLDPHCQWTWDRFPNGLRNVSVDEAADMVPRDYMFPPGNDAEIPGQRGELKGGPLR